MIDDFIQREPMVCIMGLELVPLVEEAVTAFYKSPHTRSRSFWAFKGCHAYWTFSLLGMVCALNGLDVTAISRGDQNAPCRDFLWEIGFVRYDILALHEINSLTHDIEILQMRVERYAETGERIAFPVDDLHTLDMERKNND